MATEDREIWTQELQAHCEEKYSDPLENIERQQQRLSYFDARYRTVRMDNLPSPYYRWRPTEINVDR